MVKHNNFWFSTRKSRADASAGLPRRVDVAIIGGGLNGFSLLHELLANTDLNVVLLEADSTAFHASGRGIGHIAEVDLPTALRLTDKFGAEVAFAYAKAVRINHKWLRSLISREGITCSYQKSGGIYTSVRDEDISGFEAWLEFYPESARRILDQSAMEALLPSDKFSAGVFTPGEATLNPFQLVHGIRSTCNILGQHVLNNASVRAVVQQSDGLKIYVHNRGSFMAKHVVHCTGAYCGNLLRTLKSNLSIWKTHAIASSIIPEKYMDSIPEQSIVHLDKTFRPYGDRILLSGGITPLKNAANDGQYEEPVFQRLVHWWRSVFPSMPKAISASRVWSYVNCTAKDGLPIVGPLSERPGEFISVGSDLNFSLVAAHMVRGYLTDDVMAEQQSAWATFRPDRFTER